MKKVSLKEKVQYQFDNLMAKGTIALVGMLFLATTAVILVTALLLVLISHGSASLGNTIWASLMHVIDAGTITAADTADTGFVVLMSIVTLCGIFVTSILIGIITTGFEEKLNDLKKGNSRVIEQNHTVILGFNHNIFTLISELVTANENEKDGCIVILAQEDKETIENAIADELPDLKTTRVICRTGNITDTHMLKRCSIETCRSIIVNEAEDFMTVKAILAISNYLEPLALAQKPHIVATIQTQSNYDAAQLIAKDNAEILLVQDSIARIIAQTCRQPGLSNVLMELFDYAGDELYFETFPTLAGITFGDALNCFEKAIVFGVRRDGEILLNPDKDLVLTATDALLLLVEDNGVASPTAYQNKTDWRALAVQDTPVAAQTQVLILGTNPMLPHILQELDLYFPLGSRVSVASEYIHPEYRLVATDLTNITITFVTGDTTSRTQLEQLTENGIDHVLLLSDHDCDTETSDAKTLLKLIHLRDISQKKALHYSITSEMKDVSNQKLARVAQANDLVVGSNIINLILTQISENRDLSKVFQELLSADGSEIYIRDAAHYLTLNTEVDFYTVTDLLRAQNEIAIGYKKQKGTSFEIIANPVKSEKITFTQGDSIIALSMD